MITKEQIDALESYWRADTILSVQEVTEITLTLIAEWRARQEPVMEPVCRHCGELRKDHFGPFASCFGASAYCYFEPLSQ